MSSIATLISGNWVTALQWVSRRAERVQTGTLRMVVLTTLYSVIVISSLWLAFLLPADFEISGPSRAAFQAMGPFVLLIKLGALYRFGQFSGWLTYFSLPELRSLVLSQALGSALVLAVQRWIPGGDTVPVSVLVMDFLLAAGGITALRVMFRVLGEARYGVTNAARPVVRRVGIVGAGDAGAMLARELALKRRLGMEPAYFYDDDRDKWGSRVHQIPVIGGPELLLDPRYAAELDEVIIAMPSAPALRIKEVVEILSRAGLKFQTVPSLEQLATGQVEVSHLREVEIEDLLGREPVELRPEEIREVLRGKVVLVTGAGGSIGSELCRQIARFQPRLLLLVERSEGGLFQIEQELVGAGFRDSCVPLVADVLDRERMKEIFLRYSPEVVFHAAAHKHVPMMESQPGEAVRNNTLGTAWLAELALACSVERFLLVSTDKAINPTNVMGTTKRMGEMFVQALAEANPGKTKFMAVRFGNVLGSSGSVVPLFRRQIAAGGPVTVTDPEVTRYFMTIPEAVGLVLQSAALAEGGEIFVLDMGRPVKIVDLAKQLIELSGLKAGTDIEIKFVGLRPGEKLYEELSYVGENISATPHPKILRLVGRPESLDVVRGQFRLLEPHLHETNAKRLKELLKQVVPEYRPAA